MVENMKIIDTNGKYWTDNSEVIICPVCNRKRKVLNPYGDLRGVVRCKCKTGKQITKFVFEMGGVYVYTNENGDQYIL